MPLVIWSRDFSSALSDRHGNTVAQGSQDLAAHVGTLHFTGQAIIELAGAGDSVHYDLSGSAPCVHSFLNSAFGGSTSAVIAGTKTFCGTTGWRAAGAGAVDGTAATRRRRCSESVSPCSL